MNCPIDLKRAKSYEILVWTWIVNNGGHEDDNLIIDIPIVSQFVFRSAFCEYSRMFEPGRYACIRHCPLYKTAGRCDLDDSLYGKWYRAVRNKKYYAKMMLEKIEKT